MSKAAPSTRHDLVVIGGGAVGLACAWRCAQAGRSVLVIERGGPGAGASGIAAGMLAPVTEADFGEQGLTELNLAARAEWPNFAAELAEVTGLPTGYGDCGALVVAADRDDAEELRRLHRHQEALGLDAQWLVPSAARALEPGLSPRIGGAIHARQDGRVDSAAVIAALVHALEGAGGELLAQTEVASLVTAGGRVTGVQTADGREFAATAVLVAAGAWSGQGELAHEAGAPAVRPVKGQLLELAVRRPRRPPAGRIVRTPRCYIVPHIDGRFVIGATQEEQGFDTTVTADAVFGLLEAAWEVLPDIGELEFTGARAGLRPGMPDNRPAIGRGALEGLLWATGHGRNGVLQAPLTARGIARLLGDGELPGVLRPFEPLGQRPAEAAR